MGGEKKREKKKEEDEDELMKMKMKNQDGGWKNEGEITKTGNTWPVPMLLGPPTLLGPLCGGTARKSNPGHGRGAHRAGGVRGGPKERPELIC